MRWGEAAVILCNRHLEVEQKEKEKTEQRGESEKPPGQKGKRVIKVV